MKNGQNCRFLKSKTGPIRLRNILGPVFDLRLDQALTLKLIFGGYSVAAKYAETTVFVCVQQEICMFKPTPKN